MCGKYTARRFFDVIGNCVSYDTKKLREDRTAADWNFAAEAARRGRRILQAGFFLCCTIILDTFSSRIYKYKVYLPGISMNEILTEI